MKKENVLRLIFAFSLTIITVNVKAQETIPVGNDQVTVNISPDTSKYKTESFSGINLYPAKHGNYNLLFEQDLYEDAVLEITNTAGELVFQKPVKYSKRRKSWRYPIGKIEPDTYLVTVKTSNTTYWSRFKIKE